MRNFDGSFILSHKQKIILQKFTESFLLNAIRTLSKSLKNFNQEMVRLGNDRILMQKKSDATPVTERSQWNSSETWLRLHGSGPVKIGSELSEKF